MTTMLKSPAAAERVGVHEDTLKRWRRRTAREGKLHGPPFMRIGNNIVLYPEDQLEQWIRNRMVIA